MYQNPVMFVSKGITVLERVIATINWSISETSSIINQKNRITKKNSQTTLY